MITVAVTLNGLPRQFDIAPSDVLADVLRETCGLTGCKVGCDQGVCGACTVLVNGKPVAACATFMFAVDGKAIITIEGLASDNRLHPVQQAFLACGAFQCGFCTSGMIMSVVALLAEHPDPDEATIRAWLAGNLCRCTGYNPIMAAVREAARRTSPALPASCPNPPGPPAQAGEWEEKEERAGRPRSQEQERVTGETCYIFDVEAPRMLHGKLLRSPHAHASVRRVDAAAALSIPGVVCVVTGADLAGLPDPFHGVGLRDQPVIAIDRVRHVGDVVAAVAAVDEATAFRAVQAIVVDYEPRAALMTMADALAADAPALFDGPTPGKPPGVGKGSQASTDPAPNVPYEYRFGYGDAAGVFERAEHVFTDTFDISRINHFLLEPYVNVARWAGGRLEMWSCNQDPFVLRADLARIFGLPPTGVRIHTPPVGAGFGGKSYCKMEPLVALMARKARAPVRLALSMDEGLLTLVKHPASITLTTGVDGDGRLLAREADILLDGGAYIDASTLVAIKTAYRIGGPYRWQAIASRARVVRTTTVPSGSFRGFGGTQASWASERQIDMISRRLGLDPVQFRLANLLKPGEPFAPHDRGIDCDFAVELERLAAAMRPAARDESRGIGFAIGLKDAGGTGNHAQAMVRVSQSGEVIVSAAAVDVGQSAPAALCQIATEELGFPHDAARYTPLDTDHSPPDNGTHVSCATMVTGLAIQAAARDVRAHILQFAAGRLGCPAADLSLQGWNVRRGNTDHPLEPMIRGYYGGVGWEFIGRGSFKEPYDAQTPLGARNISWMPCWSAAEVSVDRETGQVTVHRLIVVADAGRALDKAVCIGQIEGAAAQALGQALFEELRYLGEAPENATPITYRVPRAADMPSRFEGFVVEHGMGIGPGGLKGIGEAGMLGIAAAIANAIEDASGACLTSTPFTPERVLAALDVRILPAGLGRARRRPDFEV